MQPKRKLAAILFVDIAGYTSKANRDETGALSIRDDVERLVKSSTLSHHGRVVKTMGDGAMLEFRSAVEAVTCALDIQEQMDELNNRLDLAEPVLVRIGAHVGDVVEEDGDLFGNAVNIASRVHGMADPGGICITREVYVQIRPILKLQITPVMVTSAANMPEPVEVFQVRGGEHFAIAIQPRRRLLVGAVAILALVAIVFSALRFYSPTQPDPVASESSHRLLLPDWVSPGDWFALDVGKTSESLTVFFGNRKATTRFQDGHVMVQAPEDLPTNATTISVFAGSASKPLMTQLTQVINPARVAVLNKNEPDTTQAVLQKAPSVTSAKRPTPKNSKPPTTPTIPKPGVGLPPISEGYDKLVMAVSDEDFDGMDTEFVQVSQDKSSVKAAMHAVTLAGQGKRDQAIKIVKVCQESLAGMELRTAREVESLLKSATAMIVERNGDKRGPGRGPNPEFAEAFAFSMNHGTNNLPGLAMVSRLIREKNFDEARRAIEFIAKRGNLTEGEKKALGQMRNRLQKATGDSRK